MQLLITKHSYLGQRYPIPYPTPPHPILPLPYPYLIPLTRKHSYLNQRYPIPYPTLPYPTIPYHTIPYHTIPYHTIPHPFHYPTLYPTLYPTVYPISLNRKHSYLDQRYPIPTPTLPYLTPPYPTIPHPTSTYPTHLTSPCPYPTLYPTRPYPTLPVLLRIHTRAHNQASCIRAKLSCDISYLHNVLWSLLENRGNEFIRIILVT